LGRQFVELAQAVVYGRGLSAAEMAEVRRMRDRIATERGQAEGEFKTGPGGLVDVEFAVQALQLRHNVRVPHTLAALNRLTAAGVVEEMDSALLRRHYLWLRRVESVLRRMDGTGVSRLPAEELEQARLAMRLGFGSAAEFLADYRQATATVRRIYDRLTATA
jgi:glutamate-ammonia-ligase adenylyltransferase